MAVTPKRTTTGHKLLSSATRESLRHSAPDGPAIRDTSDIGPLNMRTSIKAAAWSDTGQQSTVAIGCRCAAGERQSLKDPDSSADSVLANELRDAFSNRLYGAASLLLLVMLRIVASAIQRRGRRPKRSPSLSGQVSEDRELVQQFSRSAISTGNPFNSKARNIVEWY